TDRAMRDAVETLERYADGLATRDEVAVDFSAAWDNDPVLYPAAAAAAGYAFYFADPWQGAEYTSGYALRAAEGDKAAAQADLIRCIFGNPSRAVAAVPPDVLAWNDGAIIKLARAIYDGRRWDELPVLTDALQDAGCDDAELLGHLRGPGPHALG